MTLVVEASQAGLPYDFQEHQRSLKSALADIVRPIGWPARGTFNGSFTKFGPALIPQGSIIRPVANFRLGSSFGKSGYIHFFLFVPQPE